jgi:hypothetical protein
MFHFAIVIFQGMDPELWLMVFLETATESSAAKPELST